MTHVVEHIDTCAVCREPVMGRADPHTDATVPAPGPGEAARCLLCLGMAGNIEVAGIPYLVKGELAEV
jgi:hypothetical protein